MSGSRSNLRNFLQTGRLHRNFNVSKPTDMPDIPEEKMIDGRPVSEVFQLESDGDARRGSVSSAISQLSTSSTNVGGPFTADHVSGRDATRSPQQLGDLLFIPPSIQSPTTFGPNNAYTAVPSVVTYSTARGRTRISIREASPKDPPGPARFNRPDISELHYPSIPALSGIPVIPPPPNFQPIRISHDSPALSSGSESVQLSNLSRDSAPGSDSSLASTSIRTSSASSQSIRTSTASTDDKAVNQYDASQPSAITATSSLSQPGAVLSYGHVDASSSNASWCFPLVDRQCSSIHSPNSPTRSTKADFFRSTALQDFPAAQSRFSWHVSKADRAHNWFTEWFVEWWLLEILSWLFSAICMTIIAVVLYKVDGKQSPKWKLGMTINAFISIFSGFAKSALLLPTAEALGQLKWDWFRKSEKKMLDFEIMDSASRGPWGSFIMLAGSKGVTLASVGAAIILLSLPLDLFFQQIVSYPFQIVLDPKSNATISRAIFYNPNAELLWYNGSDILGPDSQLDSFTYPFWQGSGISPGIQFDCPTGNCTYDPFYTLALDFQCKEMPGLFEFGCRNTSAEWMTTVAYEGPGLGPNVSSCGYYMEIPGFQPQLMAGYEVAADGTIGEVMSTRFFALTDVFTGQRFLNGSVNFRDVKNPVVDFILAATPGSFDGTLNNNTPVVTECEIHWVVKKIAAKVWLGKLYEESLETLQFESDLDDPWDPDDSDIYRANFSMTLPDPRSFNVDTSTFGLNNITARKVWQVWAEMAPAAIICPADSNPVKSGPVLKYDWLVAPPKLIELLGPILPWEPPNNVTQHMAEALSTMNQVIRRNTLSQTHRHDVSVGQAWNYVVLVHIRWIWITLPVALLLFSLLFLIATVVRSSKGKDQVGIWKTSALAILFNGLGEDVKEHVGSGNAGMGYTRSKAKDLKVQLDDD